MMSVLVAAACGAAVVAILAFNLLVARRNQVRNAFASLDALLKKRYDLVPNLVEVVKGYAQHERSLLEEVTRLRGQATEGALAPAATLAVNAKLGGLLGNLQVAVENYPDLKADRNFLQLQATLNEIEEQISAGRRAYNASVTAINNAVEMFPTSLLARCAGFSREPFF